MKKIIFALSILGLLAAGPIVATANADSCTVNSKASLAPKSQISNQFQNNATVQLGGVGYASSNPVALEGCLYAVVATDTSTNQKIKLYFNPIDAMFIGTGPAK